MNPTQTLAQADFLIIGGGIAGASVGYFLAPYGRVVVLERESQAGYHSTGRSAALFAESYGTAQVRALTRASRAFFEAPPAGFSAQPLVTPRGALMVAAAGQEDLLQQEWQALSALSSGMTLLTREQACARVPTLRPEKVIGAIDDPGALDVDVDALHQGFLRGLRQMGGALACDAEVTALARCAQGWRVQTRVGEFQAPVVINAAGAWADVLGQLAGAAPVGLEPRRRTAFLFAQPVEFDARAWPLVLGLAEDWYFKPDAGMLLGSPANTDPVPPQDVQPEELDVAIGIDRIEQMTTLQIRRPTHTWAGLRSFVADGDLVGGFDPQLEGFFWIAAQGGYGIQTSPAMGEICAALVRGQPMAPHLAEFGLTPAMLSPARLRPAGSPR